MVKLPLATLREAHSLLRELGRLPIDLDLPPDELRERLKLRAQLLASVAFLLQEFSAVVSTLIDSGII